MSVDSSFTAAGEARAFSCPTGFSLKLQTLLQEYRNWKEKWLLAERKLKDSPHITDEVLQTQLLNALS